jgi:hypothetical protein
VKLTDHLPWSFSQEFKLDTPYGFTPQLLKNVGFLSVRTAFSVRARVCAGDGCGENEPYQLRADQISGLELPVGRYTLEFDFGLKDGPERRPIDVVLGSSQIDLDLMPIFERPKIYRDDAPDLAKQCLTSTPTADTSKVVGTACFELGWINAYEENDDRRKSALNQFGRSCRLLPAPGCESLAWLKRRLQDGPDGDWEKLYARACREGANVACYRRYADLTLDRDHPPVREDDLRTHYQPDLPLEPADKIHVELGPDVGIGTGGGNARETSAQLAINLPFDSRPTTTLRGLIAFRLRGGYLRYSRFNDTKQESERTNSAFFEYSVAPELAIAPTDSSLRVILRPIAMFAFLSAPAHVLFSPEAGGEIMMAYGRIAFILGVRSLSLPVAIQEPTAERDGAISKTTRTFLFSGCVAWLFSD